MDYTALCVIAIATLIEENPDEIPTDEQVEARALEILAS